MKAYIWLSGSLPFCWCCRLIISIMKVKSLTLYSGSQFWSFPLGNSLVLRFFFSFSNASSTKRQMKLACVSFGMVFFASPTAMPVANGGISLLATKNALFQLRLMVCFTCYKEITTERIYSEYDTSRACAWESQEVSWTWDSGSVTVLITDRLTRPQGGTQCPGSTWKKYHPHRLEGKKILKLCS